MKCKLSPAFRTEDLDSNGTQNGWKLAGDFVY